MALSDLLWACPACGEDRGLRGARTCHRCGTRFQRLDGADIRATYTDGRTDTRTAAEWADRLPPVRSLLDGGEGDGEPVRAAAVDASVVAALEAVHGEDGYLNRIERYADPSPGVLELFPDHVRFRPPTPQAGPDRWPLDALTAVQASSSSLQLKARDRPLASFRFHDDSVYLWEQLLHEALRDLYGRTGRGRIIEFQPRIVAR